MCCRLGGRELLTIVRDDVAAHREVQREKKMLKGAALLIAMLVVCIGGLVAVITFLFKDTYVDDKLATSSLTTSSGVVISTAEHLESIPLVAAPALSHEALQRVKTLTVSIFLATFGWSESTHSVAVVHAINNAAVIFGLTLPGAQVRVINGVATYVPGTGQEAQPLCAADVTCSSLMADAQHIDALKAKAAAGLTAAGFPLPDGLTNKTISERRQLNMGIPGDVPPGCLPPGGLPKLTAMPSPSPTIAPTMSPTIAPPSPLPSPPPPPPQPSPWKTSRVPADWGGRF